MNDSNLCFNIGNKIRVEDDIFIVEAYIIFQNENKEIWTEYKIKSTVSSKIRWLSIDILNEECAIYSEEAYSEDFLEENILNNGYKKIEDKQAEVINFKGNLDVDLGEKVNYKEYEGNTRKFLLSIEEWEGETEYSKGYYIDKNSIEMMDLQLEYSNAISSSNNISDTYKDKKAPIVIGIVLTLIIIAVMLKNCSGSNHGKENLSKFISSNSSFEYVTSITSDLDKSKKANVYSTNQSVENTTKIIIDGVKDNIKDVEENKEDGTVILISGDELGLVYKGEDSKTFIQISTREYVYSSRSTPYRSSNITNMYYRDYYYKSFYEEDKKRYGNSKDAYSNYKGGYFTPNDNNKYKIYSDSIRQNSTSARTSSGDGISSGK